MRAVYSLHSGRTKTKILAAAERILRTEGVANVTIRRVAARVRLTPMAIYRHFSSKHQLIATLVSIGFSTWEMRLQGAITGIAPRQKLRKTMLAYRDFALEERRLFELMFLTPRAGVPAAPASLEQSTSPAFSQVIAAVEKSMATGRPAPGRVGDTILLVWSTAHGLITLHFAGRFGYDDRVFRRVFDRTLDQLSDALSGKYGRRR